MTKLTVLMPVYSNQAGLDRSLESLRGAHGRFTVVIVDDGSAETISAPRQLRDDIPVSLLQLEKNRGIAGALNHGLRRILAEGFDYIARLDAGDTAAPERFARQVEFLETNPGCAVVSSFVDFVDANQVPLFRFRAPCEHSRIMQRLRLNNCLVHSGSMIRADALREVGLYREDMRVTEDYELFLRLAHRYTLAVIPDVLTYCEYSVTGLSVVGRRRQQRERLKLQLRYFNPTSPHSFYGVLRTLVAMMAPHFAVFHFKRVHLR